MRRATVRSCAAGSAVGAVVGLLLCATWWVVVAYDLGPAEHGDDLVIPAGTAEAIASGAPFAFVPDRFSLAPGGHLRVVNQDSATHQIGGTAIPAGTTAEIEATDSGALLCTIHPAGELEIDIESRPPIAGMAVIAVAVALGGATIGWLLAAS